MNKMLTLIPDLHITNNFYQKNTLLDLAQNFQAMGYDSQILLLAEDADRYVDELIEVQSEVIYLFDEIQGISQVGAPLTLNDLQLPEEYKLNVRLFLDGNITSVYDGDKHIMNIDQDIKGYLKTITYYKEAGHEVERFDLRGFCSSRQFFDNNDVLIKKQWFSATGDLVMTQTQDGTITIPPRQHSRFKKQAYRDLAAVENEFLQKHIVGQQLIVEPSIDSINLRPYLLQAKVYYYFTDEQQLINNNFSGIIQQDSYLFQNETFKKIFLGIVKQAGVAFMPNCQLIPLYFANFALGTSMEAESKTIYWHVGELTNERFLAIYDQLLKLLKEHENLKVVIDANVEQIKLFKQTTKDFVTKFKAKIAELDDQVALTDLAPNELAEVQQLAAINRFSCPERLQYTDKVNLLRKAYLFLDTDVMTDYQLQLEAVKSGIPQVVRQANGLVKNDRNGFIIQQDQLITQALAVFITDLAKWNRAVVEDVGLIKQSSLNLILKKWKQVLENE